MKRAFDIVVAGFALIALSPVMAAVALVVKLESPGPVIYTQPRIGRSGRVFTMYKFRTMRTDAGGADAGVPVPRVSDFSTYVFDPLHGGKRYTRIGRFLRSGSLDELPNLINVLKGDMSIIGPRPEVPELVEQYLPEYHRRHDVRPGITGLAQTKGRGDLTYEETMQYDLEYVDDHSFLRDLKILAQTMPVVLSRKGAR